MIGDLPGRRLALLAALAAIAAVIATVVSRRSSAPAKSPMPESQLTPVAVTKAQRMSLPLKLGAQGHLVGLAQVDVRARIAGTILAVNFREGEQVSTGQLLFTIDAADVTAQMSRSQAQASDFQAQLTEAKHQLERAQQLAQAKYFSQSAVDTAQSKFDSVEAQYKAALADIGNSRALVERTHVLAPMSGLTGAVSAHIGSLVQPDATSTLVNVVQMDPIGMEFALPESSLPDLLAARAAGDLQVSMESPNGQPVAGHLVFVNNTVNVDSGTISVKAEFPNARRLLWPGAYARVQIVAGKTAAVVTLPPQSVLEGPKGRFVYVVDPQQRVTAVPIRLLRIQDELAVVDGLNGGETVVTEGQQALSVGTVVRTQRSHDGSYVGMAK